LFNLVTIEGPASTGVRELQKRLALLVGKGDR
jgi:hypothetical protein